MKLKRFSEAIPHFKQAALSNRAIFKFSSAWDKPTPGMGRPALQPLRMRARPSCIPEMPTPGITSG